MSEHAATGRFPWFPVVAVAAVGAAVGIGWAVGKVRTRELDPPIGGSIPAADPTAATDRRGELLYRVHCASCHGPEGRGDGPNAAALRPPPRDFAARPWRSEVTPESIRSVVLNGLPGTAMASFRSALAPGEVEPVVAYTLHLATSRPPVPYELPEDEQLIRDAGFVDLRGTDPPPLTVTDATGKEVQLADLKGRLVLVHFWGTNCLYCLKEMPPLKELEVRLGGRGLTVLHVCTDADDLGEAQAVAAKVVTGVRVFADQSGLGLARFEVQSLPTVWLVGPDGKAVCRAHGARDWKSPAVRRLVEHCLPGGGAGPGGP